MASGGSALNNNSAASNSGSGLPGNTNNTPSSSSGPQGSSIQSAKPSSFPPFGSMGVQGNSSQSGALGQQAVTQNSSLSGDNSAVNSQTQGPSEPPERYAMHLLLFPVLIETSCIRLPWNCDVKSVFKSTLKSLSFPLFHQHYGERKGWSSHRRRVPCHHVPTCHHDLYCGPLLIRGGGARDVTIKHVDTGTPPLLPGDAAGPSSSHTQLCVCTGRYSSFYLMHIFKCQFNISK